MNFDASTEEEKMKRQSFTSGFSTKRTEENQPLSEKFYIDTVYIFFWKTKNSDTAQDNYSPLKNTVVTYVLNMWFYHVLPRYKIRETHRKMEIEARLATDKDISTNANW